jgi:hypothetical protein
MLFEDPAEALNSDELSKLIDELDKWLKREKKMSNYPNARIDRDRRKEKLEQLIKQAPQPPTLRRIAEGIGLAFSGNEQLDILQDIAEFFQNRLGIDVSTTLEPSSVVKEEEGVTPEIQPTVPTAEVKAIGRVAPTIHTPATPTEFTFLGRR